MLDKRFACNFSRSLDFINVMTYDLHGSWDQETGMVAPLFPRQDEQGGQGHANVVSIASVC